MRRPSSVRAVAPLFVFIGGCSLVAPLSPPEDDERTEVACGDGLDNDLDGLADCEDPSCACDGCSPPKWVGERTSDSLGDACTTSCDCRRSALASDAPENLRVCNSSARLEGGASGGRCVSFETLDPDGEAAVDENAFSLSFVVERDADGQARPDAQRQNVFGIARFQGQRFTLRSMLWTPASVTFCVNGCTKGDDTVLESVLTLPLASGAENLIDDLISAESKNEAIALRTQLGPYFEQDGTTAGVNQLAVIERSTLTTDASANGPVTGRFTGRLRPPAAVDRALGGRCGDTLFHPDLQRCYLPTRSGVFFTFGCVFDAAAPSGSGRSSYNWWNPWFPVQVESGTRIGGRCAARRTSTGLEVRILPGLIEEFVPFVLVVEISEAVLAAGTTVALGTELAEATFYRIDAGRTPPFEVDLSQSLEARRLGSGRIGIEQFNAGEPPRFFGWLEGQWE